MTSGYHDGCDSDDDAKPTKQNIPISTEFPALRRSVLDHQPEQDIWGETDGTQGHIALA
jgi:hypothetical protein